MQAALPIAQPLRLPTYSVAAIVLAGLMVVPQPGNAAWPGKASVSESRLEWLNQAKRFPLVNVKAIDGLAKDIVNVNKIGKSAENNLGYTGGSAEDNLKEADGPWNDQVKGVSIPITRGGLAEIEEIRGEKAQDRGKAGIEETERIKAEKTRTVIIQHALSWRGVPYRWGGENRTGIDCSALVQEVFRPLGVELPRTSYEQFRTGVGLPMSQLLPGDLVFFSTNGPGASHVGIYLGDQKFISATRNRVEIQSLEAAYWKKAYRGGRRVI